MSSSVDDTTSIVSNDCKLFVGNLPFSVKEPDLVELFGRFGTVQGINIRKDRMTGKPKGFAFVTFQDASTASEAKAILHGSAFGGRALTVNFAEARGGGDKGGEGGLGTKAQSGTSDSSWKTVPTPRKAQSSSSERASAGRPQRTWDEWAGPV